MMALIFFVITAVLCLGRREFAEVLASFMGRLK
jgi:hypothetical protein